MIVGAANTINKSTCPFCPATWVNQKAESILKEHIIKNHHEKLDEFNKMNKEDYIELTLSSTALAELAKAQEAKKQQEDELRRQQEEIERLKKEEDERQSRQEAERTQIKETIKTEAPLKKLVTKIEIPLGGWTEPPDWLGQFLQRWDVSEQFIVLQVEKFKLFNQLPSGVELERDLNELDSGSKGKLRNSYIRQIYERALQGYMQQRAEAMRSYSATQQTNDVTGWPNLGSNQQLQQQQQPRQDIFPIPGQQLSTFSQHEQNELRELKQEVERMRQERYNEMAQKAREWEAKFEAQKQAVPAQDPFLIEMKQKFEYAERERQRLQEELTKKQTETIQNELNEMRQRTTQAIAGAPTTETIMKIAEQVIEQQKTKLSPDELKRMIQDEVEKGKTGITKEAVQMARIEKEYELDKARIDADKSKVGNYGDILNSVAGIFGESLGRGMSMGGQTPPSQQQQQQKQPYQQPEETAHIESDVKVCPSCNKALFIRFPPGVTIGQCPYCNVAIELLPSGILDFYSPNEKGSSKPIVAVKQPTMQPEPQPVQKEQQTKIVIDSETPAEKKEPPLGTCAGCGRDLYFYNIAETDIEGKQWCKTCNQNRGR